MEKIYISGQITGIEKLAETLFLDAELKLNGKGYEVVNPFKVCPYKKDYTWKDYMIADIRALVDCDIIYMLPNWVNSKGAEIERRIAMDLGITVIYE